MMVTKEECENVLSETKIYLKNQMQKKERIRHSVYLLNTITYLFEKLIHEYFDNPPLEWEEIKVNDVIFDKELKETIKIKDKFIFDDIKNITFEIFGSNRTYAGTYEEKRFYRKEVKNVD